METAYAVFVNLIRADLLRAAKTHFLHILQRAPESPCAAGHTAACEGNDGNRQRQQRGKSGQEPPFHFPRSGSYSHYLSQSILGSMKG